MFVKLSILNLLLNIFFVPQHETIKL